MKRYWLLESCTRQWIAITKWNDFAPVVYFCRNSFLFVILLTPVLADSQAKLADSIGFHSVGNTDQHGLKQGVWLNYRDRYFRCKIKNTEAFVPAEGWFFKTKKTGTYIMQSLLISLGMQQFRKDSFQEVIAEIKFNEF